MFHVSAGDTTVYAKVSESMYRQVTEFLNTFDDLKAVATGSEGIGGAATHRTDAGA